MRPETQAELLQKEVAAVLVGDGARGPGGTGQRRRPRSLTRAFVQERMTGTEPALQAWESSGTGLCMCGLTCGNVSHSCGVRRSWCPHVDRCSPPLLARYGTVPRHIPSRKGGRMRGSGTRAASAVLERRRAERPVRRTLIVPMARRLTRLPRPQLVAGPQDRNHGRLNRPPPEVLARWSEADLGPCCCGGS